MDIREAIEWLAGVGIEVNRKASSYYYLEDKVDVPFYEHQIVALAEVLREM